MLPLLWAPSSQFFCFTSSYALGANQGILLPKEPASELAVPIYLEAKMGLRMAFILSQSLGKGTALQKL